MSNPFYLDPPISHPIEVLKDVSAVKIPLVEHKVAKDIKRRAKVYKGTCIATHPSPNIGDLHSPFDGIVEKVTASVIEIIAADHGAEEEKDDKNPFYPVNPISFDGLDKISLGESLKSLGVSIRPFTRECDSFIINGLNPEPGMLYTQELFRSYMPVLEAGFEMIKRLSNASEFILAVPSGSPFEIKDTEKKEIKPVYPISLARPLIKEIMKTEATGRVTLVRLYNLFNLGLAAKTGLPSDQLVLTALGKNYLAPLGTPVSYFFDKEGFYPNEGDSVILGGAMRGRAIASLDRGLGRGDDSILHTKKNSMPALEDNPCINCGACVSVCPMRLRPNMLSRFVEFEKYERCRDEHIETCIECGMCGYICPTCRPMQQYFRIAKHQLNISSHQYVSGQ